MDDYQIMSIRSKELRLKASLGHILYNLRGQAVVWSSGEFQRPPRHKEGRRGTILPVPSSIKVLHTLLRDNDRGISIRIV